MKDGKPEIENKPITEDDFIEALKKASRPVEDQEPVEETEEDDD
jgi:hypothetical protein